MSKRRLRQEGPRARKEARETPVSPLPITDVPLLRHEVKWSMVLLTMAIGITIAAFAPVRHFDFVGWDDPKYVYENMELGALSAEQIKVQSESLVLGNYHPITMLSYALDISLAGDKDSQWMHATNLVLHLLNVLLVFLFLHMLTRRTLLASAAALLFSVNPMRVETVAWISDRKDLLMVLFGLAMLCTYIHHVRSGRLISLMAAIMFFVAACLSKGMAVSLVPSLVLVDHYLGRDMRDRKVWFEKLAFVPLAIGFGVLAVHAQVETATVEGSVHLDAMQRIVIAMASATFYLAQLLVPLHLSARYDYPSMSNGLPGHYLFAAAVFMLLLFLVWRFRKNKVLVFGLLFFLVNIVLVLQLLQVGSMVRADRYTYLAGIGPAVIIAHGALHLRMGRWGLMIGLGLMVAYAAVLAIVTRTRTHVWSTPMHVWEDMIRENPNSPTPHVSRGATFYVLHQLDSAIFEYDIALRNDPSMVTVRYDRGMAHIHMGRYEEGMKDLLEVFQAKVEQPPALLQNMIYATMKLGRYQEAGANATQALRLDPKSPFLYCVRAYCGLQLGQLPAARADIEKALTLDPNNADAIFLKGLHAMALGDTTTACEQFRDVRTAHLDDRDLRLEREKYLSTLCVAGMNR